MGAVLETNELCSSGQSGSCAARPPDGIEQDAERSSLNAANEEQQYPPLKQSLLITSGLYCTLFCVSLVSYSCKSPGVNTPMLKPSSQDETILATAIPRITDEFQSLGDVGWYGSSYLFSLAAVQMIWGKLYTLYPTKWVFLLGVVIFELGSLVCALSPSSGALIGGRVIAGLGAGSIEAGTIIIIMDTIPLRKRPIFLGILGCIDGIATVSGPL